MKILENKKELQVKTNQVKKGDVFEANGGYEIAQSNSYQKNGIWSIDISERYTYGWSSDVTEIKIWRK